MSSASAATATPRRELRDRKRDLYREVVLDAAERIFGELGYDEAKVQDLASAAGVSLTTIYRLFDSKWEIYRALYRRRLGELMEAAEAILGQDLSALERLVAGARMHLAFLMDRPDYLRLQLKEGHAWASLELLRSPEQIEALARGMEAMIATFQAAVEQGDVVDEDPEAMARGCIATQQVHLAVWVARGMEAERDEVVSAIVRQILRSYCRPERLAAALAAEGLEA